MGLEGIGGYEFSELNELEKAEAVREVVEMLAEMDEVQRREFIREQLGLQGLNTETLLSTMESLGNVNQELAEKLPNRK